MSSENKGTGAAQPTAKIETATATNGPLVEKGFSPSTAGYAPQGFSPDHTRGFSPDASTAVAPTNVPTPPVTGGTATTGPVITDTSKPN